MLKLSPKQLQTAAWTLSISVVLISFYAWASDLHWKFARLDAYRLFPLFGLLAFSLMWSHYIAAGLRKASGGEKSILRKYLTITSLAVLFCLLLHPGLLIYRLWRDGYGLPPESYKAYVGPSMVWVAILGSISLLVFFAYELHRIYGERKWWKYVQYASDAAMLAVFYHGLKLGANLHQSWLTYVWYFYGLSLLITLLYLYIGPTKHTEVAS